MKEKVANALVTFSFIERFSHQKVTPSPHADDLFICHGHWLGLRHQGCEVISKVAAGAGRLRDLCRPLVFSLGSTYLRIT